MKKRDGKKRTLNMERVKKALQKNYQQSSAGADVVGRYLDEWQHQQCRGGRRILRKGFE